MNDTLELSLETLRKGKQALVFVSTRQSAEKTAEDIAKKIREDSKKLDELAEKVLKAVGTPTRQCQRLAACVRKGIAFHHSGLTQKQKELVEDSFREGTIKIISCTPTLAAGVDLPAYRAIIRDLRRFGNRGLNWIPVLEYLQMCGRAGRPSYDTEGQAIAIAATQGEKDEIIERYVNGEPEDIYSKLAVEPVLRTYVLSLIATRFVRSKRQLVDFFSKTFWAHQFQDMQRLEQIIEKMIGLLQEWEFIRGKADDFVSADSLDGDAVLSATPVGTRVAELYLDPLTAHELIEGLQRASRWSDVPAFSLLQLLSYTLEMRPLLRVRAKEMEAVQDVLVKNESSLLTREPSMFEEGYDEFLHSIKTSMFFSDWIDESNEEQLLEKFNIRPGEIRIKLDTADWLLYATQELCKLLQLRTVLRDATKLRTRMRHGVREELLPLLRLKGIGRVRARRLFQNKIQTLGDVKKTDVATITQIIGSGAVAISVKEQLGEKVDAVKKAKRKGQMSVEKYGN